MSITAEQWNAQHPIGTKVRAWPGVRNAGDPIYTRTRSQAWTLGSGDAVVAVEGHAGGIALTHIDPTEPPNGDQPPGIDEQTRDLPDASTAAQRVRAFLAYFGDGRVDELDGPPLYARDLERLTRIDELVREAEAEATARERERCARVLEQQCESHAGRECGGVPLDLAARLVRGNL